MFAFLDSPVEIGIVVLVILLLFGGSQLPKLAKNLGQAQKEFKDGISAGQKDEANCLGVDPDLFFPERGASTREAKEVCRGCVVRMDCLEYALDNGEKFGIWGGLSERERRRLRRQRSQANRRSSA